MTIKDVILLLIFVLILIGIVYDATADMLQDYNAEVVTYIQTEYKILPEITKFKCSNKVLYKSGHVQRKYTGIAQTCAEIKMTRGEYEDYVITTLF